MVHSKLVTMEIEEGREREDLPMTSGGWIMLNSAVASLPAKVRIASSPPGWSPRKSVTSIERGSPRGKGLWRAACCRPLARKESSAA